MKWIFIAALLIFTPALTALLRAKPRYLVHTCFLLGVSLFALAPNLWVAPIPWPGWPGPVQGLEVSFVDGVSIALLLSTRRVSIPWSVKIAFAILCVAILISSFASFQFMPTVFYIWQLFRAVLLFVAVARVCATVPGASVALLAGLGIGLMYEAGLSAYQYAKGVPRPGGNLGHSNFLGLSSDFVVPAALALMLGTRRFLWPAAVVLSGLCIAVVGGSRATLALTAFSILLTIAFSIQHKMSSRKLAFAGGAALLLLVLAPVMMWAANQRTEESKLSSDGERDAMKLAARMIITDHPFGVGANDYVVVANTGGYSQRAGVAWNFSSRSAPVHDTYYLVTAELGFLGLIGFCATLASFVVLGFRLLRQRLPDETIELVPGLLATMIVASIHISFEWVFMHFIPHYLFAVAAGLMVAVAARAKSPAKTRAPVLFPVRVPSPAS